MLSPSLKEALLWLELHEVTFFHLILKKIPFPILPRFISLLNWVNSASAIVALCSSKQIITLKLLLIPHHVGNSSKIQLNLWSLWEALFCFALCINWLKYSPNQLGFAAPTILKEAYGSDYQCCAIKRNLTERFKRKGQLSARNTFNPVNHATLWKIPGLTYVS